MGAPLVLVVVQPTQKVESSVRGDENVMKERNYSMSVPQLDYAYASSGFIFPVRVTPTTAFVHTPYLQSH